MHNAVGILSCGFGYVNVKYEYSCMFTRISTSKYDAGININ